MPKAFRIAGVLTSVVILAVVSYMVAIAYSKSVYDTEYSFGLSKVLVAYATAILLLFFGPVSDISALIKIKVTLAVSIATATIGFIGWLLISPSSQQESISLVFETLSFSNILLFALIVFLTAVFLSLTFGNNSQEFAFCGVAFALSVCAVRGGLLTVNLGYIGDVGEIHKIYQSLAWEGFAWLGIVLVAFAGSHINIGVSSLRKLWLQADKKNIVIGFVVSVVIGVLGTNLLTLGARVVVDSDVFSVVRQAYTGQICFGVLVSFCGGAYLCRHFLRVHYIVPTIASGLVVFITMSFASSTSNLEYLSTNLPSSFLLKPSAGVLPIQMVAFGSLGSIIGYWLSYSHQEWQKENLSKG